MRRVAVLFHSVGILKDCSDDALSHIPFHAPCSSSVRQDSHILIYSSSHEERKWHFFALSPETRGQQTLPSPIAKGPLLVLCQYFCPYDVYVEYDKIINTYIYPISQFKYSHRDFNSNNKNDLYLSETNIALELFSSVTYLPLNLYCL